jgi:hypothetical protein
MNRAEIEQQLDEIIAVHKKIEEMTLEMTSLRDQIQELQEPIKCHVPEFIYKGYVFLFNYKEDLQKIVPTPSLDDLFPSNDN